ncbi:MAG: hypothetical protein M1831_007533 [Alyxoria varia]|nr:MAG: hypothetical protein M1831_007533 [Alyxoria varia]
MRRLPRSFAVSEARHSSSARRRPNGAVCLLCQRRARARPTQLATRSICTTPIRPDIGDRVTKWASDKIWKKPPSPRQDEDPENQAKHQLADEERERQHELQEGRPLDFDEEPVLTPEEKEEQERAREDAVDYERAKQQEDIDKYQDMVDTAYEHGGYEPSETWTGLEEVGGEKEEDTRDMEFVGFLPQRKLTVPEEITMALYRAAVEVHAAHALDIPLTEIPTPYADDLVNATKQARLEPKQDGNHLGFGALTFPSQEVEDSIMSYMRLAIPETHGTEIALPNFSAQEEDIAAKEDGEEAGEASKSGSESSSSSSDESSSDESSSEDEPSLDEAELPHQPIPTSTASVPQPEPYTVNTLRLDLSHIDASSPSWRSLSLANPDIRLGIYRRALQLTGQTIPDNILSTCGTVGDLIAQMVQHAKPTPKGLYDEMIATQTLREQIERGDLASEEEIVRGPEAAKTKVEQGENDESIKRKGKGKKENKDMVTLFDLPNVTFSGRRITPVDKEKQVGRWKVIEDELESRNLPVLGKG